MDSSDEFPLLISSRMRVSRSRVRAMVKARRTPKRNVVMEASATSTLRSRRTEPIVRETAAATTPDSAAGQITISPLTTDRAARLIASGTGVNVAESRPV